MSYPDTPTTAPLRIILDLRTATPHFPGIGRYAASLADALAPQLATDEELVLLEPPQGTWPFVAAPDHPVRRVAVAASPFDLAQQWQVRTLMQRLGSGPAVYHSLYFLMPYWPGAPAVWTFHDLIPLLFPHLTTTRTRLVFQMGTRLALRRCAATVAVSQAAKADLVARFHVDPHRVSVAPHGVDARFRPQSPEASTALRTRLGLPPMFVLYVGSNKPHKNLTTLVAAYGQLSASAPPLVIAGAWDARYPEAQQLAAAHGIAERLRFLGAVADADLPGLYAAATLFVFPSRYEGFGLPVLEAMACGVPVVAANTSSLPEVAGAAARLVDPLDAMALASALQELLDSPAQRQQLAAAGPAQASQFTWAATAAKTLAVYRTVAAAQVSKGARYP